MANLNQSPYYDDHKTQFYEKNYKEVLFNPGRAVQARELTQSQSFVYDQLKENFKTLYKNGSIISGMNVSVKGTTFYMDAGEFYYEGRVYNIPEQSITITGTGTENLGLKLIEEFVTATDDNALLDPANGYTNYGNPGADRLKQTWQLVKDDENMITLWTLIDGNLQINPTDEWSDLLALLAKRTYDESGNYLVDGMELHIEDNEYDSNKVDYIINPGNAYVKGYNISLPSPYRIAVEKAMNYDSRKNEPKTWTTGTYKYKLIEYYTKDLTEVNGQVQTTIYVTKGTTNGQDSFTANSDPNNPQSIQGSTFTSIISIDEITSSDGSTVYQNGADYVLTNDKIDWSPGGAEPNTGDTYKVKFTYSKTYVIGSEVTLEQDTTDDRIYYVHFNENLDDPSYPHYTNYPINGTVFYVDYDFYLARTDLISVDYKGNFIVKKGIDTKWDKTIIPDDSVEYLQLGYIKLMPNRGADEAQIVNFGYKRSTMMTLFHALKRLEDVEYNQAELALEAEVEKSELPTELRGILVDNFSDFGKCDTGSTEFYCSINDVDNDMGMAVVYEINNFDFDNASLTNVDNYGNDLIGALALKKTSDYVLLVQTQKTHTESLNPYEFLNGKTGYGKIKPKEDYWVESSLKRVYRTRTINETYRAYSPMVIQNTRFIYGHPWTHIYYTTNYVSNSLVGQNITYRLLGKRQIGTAYVDYARNINIAVKGYKWVPSNKILILFDNKPVNAIAPEGQIWDSSNQGILWDKYTVNGVTYTCPIVQNTGEFNCQLTIPSGTRTGTHTITLKNVDSGYEFSTTFVSHGVKRIYEELIEKTIHRMYSRVRYVTRVIDDPIAQSFSFEEDVILTGIDLYFSEKSTSDSAFLEIGFMNNGYPDTNAIILYQTIDPSSVQISSNGSAVTHINFDRPILIPSKKEFFIALGSTSKDYKLFVAKMGENDIATKKFVVKNPYLNGVFFKSSNNSTWNAFQDIDLAFKLYAGKFETSGVIVTENITPTESFCQFKYFSNAFLMANTNVNYFYSVDGGTTWNAFDPKSGFVDIENEETSIMLKFELTGDGNATPLIYKTANQIITGKYDITKDNYYVTRTVENLVNYNDVKVGFNVRLPQNTDYELYFSPDDELWIQIPESKKISETILDASIDYPKYMREYEYNLSNMYKVDISNVSGTPIVSSTISSSTGGGSPTGTLIAVNNFHAIFEITGGSLTEGETITLSDGSSFIINNIHNMVDNTVFKGKIKLNGTVCRSPLFSELKYIMKTV